MINASAHRQLPVFDWNTFDINRKVHLMASIISGLEYDVFISYRHNDNLDGWVTEFVQSLERELKGTLKDGLSIYFDKNATDGLLETHNVDRSLEGKLKCLIFIPIISQTYCDPKSFAWQYEFCAFNRLSKQDELGRDIRLSTGNVTSRILPIKIHDLDADDKAEIEKEIGGPLRAIEMIYKEPGVNRPLKPTDLKGENLNKIDYRNQVNKVANAIKEIVQAIRNPSFQQPAVPSKGQPTGRSQRALKVSVPVIALLLAISIAIYFIFLKSPARSVEVDKSIAVLPFVNMSADPEQEYFSDGISEELLNVLAKVPELKVTGRTSSFYFKGKNEDLRVIGEKLHVAHLLEGSVRKDGDKVRITAQLIRAADGTHLWSETYERKLDGVFKLQDEIAAAVSKELRLKILGLPSTPAKSNTEAHNLLLKGKYAFYKFDIAQATEFYQQALKLDSTDAEIWTSLSTVKFLMTFGDFTHREDNFKEAKYCAERALAIDNNFSDAHRAKGFANMFDGDWENAESEYNLALRLDPNNSEACRTMGILKLTLGQFDEALVYGKKSVELNPLNLLNLNFEVGVYMAKGDYAQASARINEALSTNPEWARYAMIFVYMQLNKPQLALKRLEEFSNLPENNESRILLAKIKYQLGDREEAKRIVERLLKGYNDYSYDIAMVYAFMNQRDEAFKWLDKAVQERFRTIQIKADPASKNLQGDPRYTALLKKLNLPLD